MTAKKRQPKYDVINKPKHYNQGDIQPIEVMVAWRIGFYTCLGNAIKYIARYPHKGVPAEDLKKAHWYTKKARQIINGEAKKQYYQLSEIVADWNLPPEAERALRALSKASDSDENRTDELDKACKSLERQIKQLTD